MKALTTAASTLNHFLTLARTMLFHPHHIYSFYAKNAAHAANNADMSATKNIFSRDTQPTQVTKLSFTGLHTLNFHQNRILHQQNCTHERNGIQTLHCP